MVLNPNQPVSKTVEEGMRALKEKLETEGLLAQVALWCLAGKVPSFEETLKEGRIALGTAIAICAQYGLIDEDEEFIKLTRSYFLKIIGDDGMFVGHTQCFFARVGELRRESPEALRALVRMNSSTKDISPSILRVLEDKSLADRVGGLLPEFAWLVQTALKVENTGVKVINPFPQDTELHGVVEGLL